LTQQDLTFNLMYSKQNPPLPLEETMTNTFCTSVTR